MSDEHDKPIVPWGIIYAAFAFCALAQVAVIAMWITGDLRIDFVPVGNFTALLIMIGGAWLMRQRQKGRL